MAQDPRQLKVDLSTAQDIVCENCNNQTFEAVMMFKKLSALVSPNGKEAIVPIDTFACVACGYVNKIFRPVTNKVEEARAQTTEEVGASKLILEP